MSNGEEKNPFDPMEPFRKMRDAYLNAMAKTMVEAVNTEAYAQTSGAMLEGYLSAAAPFREAREKSMTQALQQMSLPSRQEVAALAERFTHVEMRLDDMDAKLDRIGKMLNSEAPHPSTAEEEDAQAPETENSANGNAPASAKRTVARRRLARRRSAESARK